MEREIALEVNDLRITYKCLKSFSIKQSLLKFKKAKTEVYEAVRGVSFSLPKGEILGIVGKNGSILFLVDLELADGDAIQDALTGAYLHCTLLLHPTPSSYTRKRIFIKRVVDGCSSSTSNSL